MSPYNFNGGFARVLFVESNGYLSDDVSVSYGLDVHPVINLRADIALKGNGITSSPYEVK